MTPPAFLLARPLPGTPRRGTAGNAPFAGAKARIRCGPGADEGQCAPSPRVSNDLNHEERLEWERVRVERARSGDTGAFAELYRAYAPTLFSRVLLPKLGNREAAEDALSETFRTAYERLDGFEARGVSVYFWLARIATNKALDLHRAKATTGRALASFEGLLGPLTEAPPDPSELLDLRSQTEHLRGAVAEVLSRLNPRYRTAIELRFGQELSREDCAERLEVKLGTFDVLILRALRAFRKEWADVIGEDGPHDE